MITASSVYVRNKKRACEYIGIGSLNYELPEETTEAELLDPDRGTQCEKGSERYFSTASTAETYG